MEHEIGKIPSRVEEIPEQGDAYHAALERLNETLAGVKEQVNSHPWASVGVGFGVGVLVGALVTLAASSRRSIY